MPEQEELKLIVTLDDQASAQLGNLRASLASMSESIARTGASVGGKSREAAKGVGELQSGLVGLIAKGTFLGNMLTSAAKEIGNLGAQVVSRVTDLEGLSREMLNTSHAAYTLGTSTAQLRENLQSFREAGVPLNEAQRALQGIADTFVDLQSYGSRVRQTLMMTDLPVEKMRAFADELQRATDPDQLAGVIRRQAPQIRELATLRYNSAAIGARMEQDYLRVVQAQGIERTKQAKEATEFQKQLDEDRKVASAAFTETSAKTSEAYERTARSMGFIVEHMLTSTGAAGAWSRLMDKIAGDMENIESRLRKANELADKAAAAPGFWGGLNPFNAANAAREQAVAPALKNFPGATPENLAAPGGVPQMFMGGGMPALGPYSRQTGGLRNSILEHAPESTNIEDRRATSENTDSTEVLTTEIRKLNETLTFPPFTGTLGGEAGGIAGKLGVGDIGGGGRGGGGGATGGWTGPTGAATTGGGATGSGGGATTVSGGGAGGDMPVVAGAGGVPGAILAQAQEVALQGGPGAVDAFMRKQGFPREGNWCGQFAAAVVKGAGGTPPANPGVASNWRNWGTQVDIPQPGDVAVRMRTSSRGGAAVATGSTGSHVTFVQGVSGGQFTGLGGNQGNFQSQYPTSAFQFFRGQGSQGQQGQAGGVGGDLSGQLGIGAIPAVPGGGSAALQADRQKFAREMQDPGVQRHMAALLNAEVPTSDPRGQQALVESIFNRASARNQSLMRTMQRDYYEPMRTSAFGRQMAQLTPGRMQALQGILGSVAGGSNIGGLATGNASGSVGFAGGPQTIQTASRERFGIEGPDVKWARQMAQRIAQGGPAAVQQAQAFMGQVTGAQQATPVTVVGVSTDASRTLAESNQRIANTAAQATAAAVKAGATPEVAAAAGAAAAQAAGGTMDKPAGMPPIAPKPDPAQQAEDAKKAQRAQEDAEIARLEEKGRLGAIRREDRGLTRQQREAAQKERDEAQREAGAGQNQQDAHTREGEKLQADAERRDNQRAVRERRVTDREEKRSEKSRQRIFEEKYGRTIPYKKMTDQQKIDFLKRKQEREDLEAAQKKAEDDYQTTQKKEAEDKLTESRKSLEELEDEAEQRRDPESVIERTTAESRRANEYERDKERKAKRTGGVDPVAGYSSAAGKALDTSGRALDAAKEAVKVEADGTLTVDVKAPRSTSVSAKGKGAFKKTVTNRQTQMEPAESGPDHDPELDS